MTPSTDESHVWFITGASSGLGRALSEVALEQGKRVVVTARNPERIAGFERRYPGRAVATRLDVVDPNQARAAVDTALAVFGRLDVVVNNAGYGLFGALEELSDAELRRQFDTIVFGSINVIRAALPQLRRQRAGHIVQISSLEGVAPALAGESAYAGAKFAVEGLVEVLAKEVAHLGIRVTIVEPGPIRTNFAEGSTAKPPTNEDYTESVGKAFAWFQEMAGNQPNDPARVAAAIVQAVEADDPPLRLPLGAEALEAIRKKIDEQRREADVWEQVSAGTAFVNA